MIDTKIIVDDSHFEYLKVQKGKLDPLIPDRQRWHAAYERDLLQSYDEIKPYLPNRCWGLLDVGSGLGGIDVLLYRHYCDSGRQGPYINLLDGKDDPPEVKLHRQTFNSMKVARDFQKKNGVPGDRLLCYTPESTEFGKPFDLVISLGSWCFHYEPDVYLPRLCVASKLMSGMILIVDLRLGKFEWANQLARHASIVAVVRRSHKFHRIVYVVDT